MKAIEAKENLIIGKDDYHKDLQEVTWKQDITGTTLFNLCAYHMLKIVKEENGNYVVAVDSDLIDGLPEAYAYIAEFIRELREYNGLTGSFTATMASVGNFDGGISKNIERPVSGAAKHEPFVTMTVDEGEYPYTKIQKEKAEAARRKAAEERARKEREEEERKKEIDQYHTDHKNWENRCQEILNAREAYVEEKLSSRQKEIEEEARKEYDLAVESLKKEQAEQEERESTAQARLSSLGMFKFSEKKEQKAIIEDAVSRISAARDALMKKERELRDRLSAASGEAKKETQKYNIEAIAELPLPEEPPKPAALLYEEEQERERQRKKEEEERRRKELAKMPTPEEQEALSWLGSYGTTADEVAEYMRVSKLRANALLSSLVVKGKAERYYEKRVAYFRRTD